MTTSTSNAQRNRRAAMRKIPRGTVKLECRLGSSGLGRNLAGLFLDISEGGACFAVSEALKPKTEVEVLISGVNRTKPIRRLANVCWSVLLDDGNFCIGVEFQKRLLFAEVAQSAKP